jgi:predicted secreted protein
MRSNPLDVAQTMGLLHFVRNDGATCFKIAITSPCPRRYRPALFVRHCERMRSNPLDVAQTMGLLHFVRNDGATCFKIAITSPCRRRYRPALFVRHCERMRSNPLDVAQTLGLLHFVRNDGATCRSKTPKRHSVSATKQAPWGCQKTNR